MISVQDAKLANDALIEATKAQNQAKDASTKVEQAKRELEDIAAILQNVEEPGRGVRERCMREMQNIYSIIEHFSPREPGIIGFSEKKTRALFS